MFSPDYEKRLLQSFGLLDSSDKSARPSSSDRFIPCRANNKWHAKFHTLPRDDEEEIPMSFTELKYGRRASGDFAYNFVLKNELLGGNLENVNLPNNEAGCPAQTHHRSGLFTYRAPMESDFTKYSATSLSPISDQSRRILETTNYSARKISSQAYKVLDAPDLSDDFYLNLLDWSSTNVLAVGLESAVYFWNATNSQVSLLCDVASEDNNTVTSVGWNEAGNKIAVGTHHGSVTVWDATTMTEITKLLGHTARVGSIAWNCDILASGSLDRSIIQHDMRLSPERYQRKLLAHRQEVCGLKWSPDKQYLASGGNDNRLYVWNQCSRKPVLKLREHTAAVKAIAWSPHKRGLLSSGGGSADGCIRHWNTLLGSASLQCVDTGSQVCNLAWSKHSPQLVSTHGYTNNEIIVWRYPAMSRLIQLRGHTKRPLFLSMSPDGEAIVTGASDETVRFWKIFQKPGPQKNKDSRFSLYGQLR